MHKNLSCGGFLCTDVRHECYAVPPIHVSPNDVSIILISEAAPADRGDYYYAKGSRLFLDSRQFTKIVSFLSLAKIL